MAAAIKAVGIVEELLVDVEGLTVGEAVVVDRFRLIEEETEGPANDGCLFAGEIVGESQTR